MIRSRSLCALHTLRKSWYFITFTWLFPLFFCFFFFFIWLKYEHQSNEWLERTIRRQNRFCWCLVSWKIYAWKTICTTIGTQHHIHTHTHSRTFFYYLLMLWIVYRVKIHFIEAQSLTSCEAIESWAMNEMNGKYDRIWMYIYYTNRVPTSFSKGMKEMRKSTAKRLMPIAKQNKLTDGNTHNLHVSHRFKCQIDRDGGGGGAESDRRPSICWAPFECTYIFKLENNVMRKTLNNSKFHFCLFQFAKGTPRKKIRPHLSSLC